MPAEYPLSEAGSLPQRLFWLLPAFGTQGQEQQLSDARSACVRDPDRQVVLEAPQGGLWRFYFS